VKYISLFAGIGGLDLGLERAGMQCVAQVEIDEFCQKVLQKNFPNVPKFKDVRDVGKHNLPAADLICGGFPCQPHSYAGKRRGKDDDRNLWGEYLRVIREIQPRFVIGENVPGLITTMLDEVLSDLENVGYTAEAFVIPACAFDAPHRRNRVFIVAENAKRNGRGIGADDQPVGVGVKRDVGAGDEVGVHLQPATADANGSRYLYGRYEVIAAEPRQYAQCNASAGNWNEHWLEVAARLCRVDDGVSDRVDRLRALGNAVVPQVAEWIGKRIMEIES
jgi:DNA (cytosine-5)-methyltransferase 1